MAVLCFGSYAQLLMNATKLKQYQLVDLLFRCCEPTGSYNLDSGDISNWVNAKKPLPSYITDNVTKSVADKASEYFEKNILGKIQFGMSKQLLEEIYGLIVNEKSILPEVKKDLAEYASLENASLFLSRVFLYVVKQNNVVSGDPLKDLTKITLPNIVKFEKTIHNQNFDNVFIKVENCSFNDDFNIEFRRFNIINKSFDYVGLNNFLYKNLGRYLFSRAKIEKMVLDGEQDLIVQRAIKFLKNKGNMTQLSDEVGNLIIYVLLEEILQAPKVLYQISITAEGSLSNNGGLHLLRAKTPNTTHQIIFTKSKLRDDLTLAVDSAFDIILSSKNSDIANIPLLEPTIMNGISDETTQNFLKNILIPSKSSESIESDNAFAIFLGYNIGIKSNRDNIEQKMKSDIQSVIPYIKQKIQDNNLGQYPFYFYCIPFNDIDNDKMSIFTSITGGEING